MDGQTIVALATPPGRSGIGVIRISGSGSLQALRRISSDDSLSPVPRKAFLLPLIDPSDGFLLDETLVTFFKAPNSYTGEDTVEISCHGSPIILRRVLDVVLASGARLAEPGEFTLRALSNGKLNLAQAEAVRDLIDAQSVAAVRQSVRQLKGELSNRLQPIKDQLLDVIVALESSLEFVEDDLPDVQIENIKTKLQSTAETIGEIAATFSSGRLLRDGIRIALVGRPNVGKSSLFNALLGEDRAIVTEVAGTTRDRLHERLIINEIPVSLFDTAGMRETNDVVEKIGVERSKQTMADADLILVLLDGSDVLTEEDSLVIDSVKGLNHLLVVNKIDLPSAAAPVIESAANVLRVSAKTGEGIENLRNSIVDGFRRPGTEAGGFLISDARHYDLLSRSHSEIIESIELLSNHTSEEMVLVGLHNALRSLGEITGETTTEDMLTRIFSTFCIGK
jgi:tRNA modification GTPase